MKRNSLKKNINRFIKRYHHKVIFQKYTSTADQADAPYRQRKRKYGDDITIDCAVVERRSEDMPTSIGDGNLRRVDVCTGPDQLTLAFHPLDFDDPRITIDPSLLIDRKDRIKIEGIVCNILHITRHGNDGGGPLWYVIRCEESLE